MNNRKKHPVNNPLPSFFSRLLFKLGLCGELVPECRCPWRPEEGNPLELVLSHSTWSRSPLQEQCVIPLRCYFKIFLSKWASLIWGIDYNCHFVRSNNFNHSNPHKIVVSDNTQTSGNLQFSFIIENSLFKFPKQMNYSGFELQV